MEIRERGPRSSRAALQQGRQDGLLQAVYPGAPKKEGVKAVITVATAKARLRFKGEIGEAHDDDPPNATHFLQWDLGYRRQDPAL